MKGYSTGIHTKNKIIQVCKELFYDYGLEETSYKMICEKADVNRGLLPYHFKSKDNIAYHIYKEFLSDFDKWRSTINCFSSYFENFATCEFILYKFIYQNPNYMKFYTELKSSQILKPQMLNAEIESIQKTASAYNLFFSEEALCTLACMSYGVEHELIYNSYHGLITEPAEEIAKKDLVFVFSMLSFDSDEIQQTIEHAQKLAENFSIEMTSGFQYRFIEY